MNDYAWRNGEDSGGNGRDIFKVLSPDSPKAVQEIH
jgi:hypothetical protein